MFESIAEILELYTKLIKLAKFVRTLRSWIRNIQQLTLLLQTQLKEMRQDPSAPVAHVEHSERDSTMKKGHSEREAEVAITENETTMCKNPVTTYTMIVLNSEAEVPPEVRSQEPEAAGQTHVLCVNKSLPTMKMFTRLLWSNRTLLRNGGNKAEKATKASKTILLFVPVLNTISMMVPCRGTWSSTKLMKSTKD